MKKQNTTSPTELLTREDFKKLVFKKTNGVCCVPGCCEKAVDAHHIMDRKLWSSGGYYLSNGAALCAKHHLDAENGIITPVDCMMYMHINVDDLLVPDRVSEQGISREEYIELFTTNNIDKWGK